METTSKALVTTSVALVTRSDALVPRGIFLYSGVFVCTFLAAPT